MADDESQEDAREDPAWRLGREHPVRPLTALGFEERIRGSQRIFRRDDIEEIVTLQPKGSKAKAYQVRQVRQIINRYGLASHGEE